MVRQRSAGSAASDGSGGIYGGGAAATVHQWRGGDGGGEGVRRTAGFCRQERGAPIAPITSVAAVRAARRGCLGAAANPAGYGCARDGGSRLRSHSASARS